MLSSGYAANLAVLTTLADAGTLVVSDEHAHASLIDGCRLSRAAVSVARHNDLDHVAELLGRRDSPRAVVVAESIYSVLGDAAPVEELIALTAEAGAILVVDEAHALGVVGPRGGGLVAAAGSGAEHVVVTATLSKSLAAQGGAVLASPVVREHLVNTARPFIYDTGLAPASAGAALAAIQVLHEHPELTARVHANAARLADACGVEHPAGAVMSVRDGRAARGGRGGRARRGPTASAIGCFRPPSTPDGSVAAAPHRARRPRRARPRPGLRGARRAHRTPWLTRARSPPSSSSRGRARRSARRWSRPPWPRWCASAAAPWPS